MKTIDLLVEELPKRGGWPEKVTHIGQDYDRELMFYGRGNVRTGIILDQLAVDHRECGGVGTKITREQYESALAAKNDGWIEWGGGECPVEKGALVDVKYRSGEINQHVKAGVLNNGGSMDTALAFRWSKLDEEYDIIAYRLHKPQDATTRANDYMLPQDFGPVADEADLNDCIGQTPVTVWNGEGLPPVGCVCERSWAGDKWLQCEIIFTGNEIVLVKLATREAAYHLSDVRFRHIRSEAERKREEAVAQLNNFVAMGKFALDEDLACAVYDAIADGKIPGVKLED